MIHCLVVILHGHIWMFVLSYLCNYGGSEQRRLQFMEPTSVQSKTPSLHIKKDLKLFFLMDPLAQTPLHMLLCIDVLLSSPSIHALSADLSLFLHFSQPSQLRRMTTYLEAVSPWGFCLLKVCFFSPWLLLLVGEYFLTADRRVHRDVLFFGVAFTDRTVEWEMDGWFSLVL